MSNPYRVVKYLTDEEWQKKRQAGITSTDVAGIIGIKGNYIKTPYQIWQRKISDELPPREMSKAASFGLRVEGIIAQQFSEEFDMKVRNSKALYQSVEYPFMLTSIDRFVWDDDDVKGILEIKSMSKWVYEREWKEKVPLKFFTQVNHQMFVLGLPFVYFAAWITESREIIPFRLNRDDEYIKKQNAVLVDFWENNVLKKIPPTRTVVDLESYVTDGVSSIQTDEKIVKVCQDLIDIKKKIKALTDQKEPLEIEIKEYMGLNGRLLEGDELLVSWLTAKAGKKFDEKSFKEDHADLHSVYLIDKNPRRTFRVKGFDEDKE